MLVLLPSLFLLFIAAILVILHRSQRTVGYAWISAVVGTLLVWLFLLFSRFQPPAIFLQPTWQPAVDTEVLFAFQSDDYSWPYAFALASVLVAYILTSAARLQKGSSPNAWAGAIALVAAGFIACFSATPLALAATWTLIDLIELAIFLSSLRDDRDIRDLVASFSFRLIGTIFLLWALIVTRGRGEILAFGAVIPQAGIFLLIAAGLRMSVIPLYLPHVQDSPARREFGTMIRITVSASGLAYLGRFPAVIVDPGWSVFILIFTTLALLYGSVMWSIAKDEIAGRPYWLIALASMAISSTVRGSAQSSITWGVLMILCGSVLFLSTERTRIFRWINIVSVFAMLGLPFTPSAAGWLGLIILPFNLMDVIVILAYAILLVGMVRHALRLEVSPEGLEPWVQVVYPTGLIILIIAQWLTAVFGVIPLTVGVWYAATAACILALTATLFLSRRNLLLAPQEGAHVGSPLLPGRAGIVLNDITRVDWLYSLLAWLYRLLRSVVFFITRILEGDGGLLWVILLLALMATFLRGRGAG